MLSSLLLLPHPRFCALHAYNKNAPVNIWHWTCLRDSNRLFLAISSFLFLPCVKYIGIASFNGQQFLIKEIWQTFYWFVVRQLLSFLLFIFICKAHSNKKVFFIQNDHNVMRRCFILENWLSQIYHLEMGNKTTSFHTTKSLFYSRVTCRDKISWIFEAICMKLIWAGKVL